MEGLWIGIIFLMNTASGGSLPFGLNDEYFKSEKECEHRHYRKIC